MEIFVVSYVIQLSLGAYALFGLPMRGELPGLPDMARKQILLFAILPCAFLSVIIQIIWLLVYFAAVKSAESKTKAAEAKLGSSSSTDSENPFGAPSPRRPSPPVSENPFSSGGQDSSDSGVEPANPFASDDPDSSPNHPDDNPFA